MLVLLTWEEAHCSHMEIIHPGAMNKGNILFSHESEHRHPQPDGSVVKTSVFKHLGFIIIFLGDNGSQKGQLRLVL
jgi:hypothetical protein